MKKIALLGLVVGLILSIAGCGGQAGRNSPTQVRMESDPGTTSLAALHVIISPNNGSSTSTAAASDQQSQTWATYLSSSTYKELDFTTTSQQVPYFVYIKNDDAAQQTVTLRILMDGDEKLNQSFTVAGSSTVQVQTIYRNNIQN